MMDDLILKAKDLYLEYSVRTGMFKRFKHTALDGVSLSLKRGEVLGITGKNGAGKSTLLKVLAGVLTPDAGEIIIGKDVTRSLLSLGLGFNNDLTGRDNAIISCMLNGLSKKAALAVVEEIKDFSELGEFFEQPVRTYSSGMRARLGFSTGVVTEVDILLIDEVLSVGDAKFRKKAEKVMVDKLKGHTSVVFVSHSEEQINRLCDRVIKL